MASEAEPRPVTTLSDTFLALPSASKDLIEAHVASLKSAAAPALAGAVKALLESWRDADATLQAWLATHATTGAIEYVLVSQEESECVPGVVYYGGCLRALAVDAAESSGESPAALIAAGTPLLAAVHDATSSIESALRLHDDALLLLGAAAHDDFPPPPLESDAGSSDGSRAQPSQRTHASDAAFYASPMHEEESLSSAARKRPRGRRGGSRSTPRRSPSTADYLEEDGWEEDGWEEEEDASGPRKRPRAPGDDTIFRTSRRVAVPAPVRPQRSRKASAVLREALGEESDQPRSEPRRRGRGRAAVPGAPVVRRTRPVVMLPPARIVKFTPNGSTFVKYDMTTLTDAARYLFEAAPAGYKDVYTLTQRMKGVLATRDNRGGKTYNHPVEAEGDNVVHYLVQYLTDPAPISVEAVSEMWVNNADSQKCTINRIGDAPMKPARAARVIVFNRSGYLRLMETPTMLAAGQHVYAAAGIWTGSPGALSARVGGVLGTRDGRGGKTYNHPIQREGMDVLHFMIQLAVDEPPATSAAAWELWCFNENSQFDECSRKDGPDVGGRPSRVVAFTPNERVFTVTNMANLLHAAEMLRSICGVTHVDVISFAWHIYGVLRSRSNGPVVYLQRPTSLGDDDVRYMVQYATEAAPNSAAEAWDLWRAKETARGAPVELAVIPPPAPPAAAVTAAPVSSAGHAAQQYAAYDETVMAEFAADGDDGDVAGGEDDFVDEDDVGADAAVDAAPETANDLSSQSD